MSIRKKYLVGNKQFDTFLDAIEWEILARMEKVFTKVIKKYMEYMPTIKGYKLEWYVMDLSYKPRYVVNLHYYRRELIDGAGHCMKFPMPYYNLHSKITDVLNKVEDYKDVRDDKEFVKQFIEKELK